MLGPLILAAMVFFAGYMLGDYYGFRRGWQHGSHDKYGRPLVTRRDNPDA